MRKLHQRVGEVYGARMAGRIVKLLLQVSVGGPSSMAWHAAAKLEAIGNDAPPMGDVRSIIES